MEIELLHFDDCPHWKDAEAMLAQVAGERGDLTVRRRLVTTDGEAKRLGFDGSPSIHVGGVDVFSPSAAAEPGLSCHVYATPNGFAGTPRIEELRAAISRRTGGGSGE